MNFHKQTNNPLNYYDTLDFNNTNSVKDVFELLLNKTITSTNDLKDIILKLSGLIETIKNKNTMNNVTYLLDLSNDVSLQTMTNFKKSICHLSDRYALLINKKIVNSIYFNDLQSDDYKNYKIILISKIEFDKTKNVSLKEAEEHLVMNYRKVLSGIEATIENKRYKARDLLFMSESKVQNIRKNAWLTFKSCFADKKDELDKIYNALIINRNKQAHDAGYKNFKEYKHQEMGRFDYTSEDLEDFHTSVVETVVPLLKTYNLSKCASSKQSKIKPWDEHLVANKEFKMKMTTDEIISTSENILRSIDSELLEVFEGIKKQGHIDLEKKENKASGGFCYTIKDDGTPFIFMNAHENYKDVGIFMHELGHCFHSVYASQQPLRLYKMMEVSCEVAELASTTLEVIAIDYLNKITDCEASIMSLKHERYIEMLKRIRRTTMIDEFQHWVYSNPNHTVKERDDHYRLIEDKYDIGIDWDGYEAEKASGWIYQLHVFGMPFYYIEYAITTVAAIDIYRHYKTDKNTTISKYKDFLRAGNSRPTKELFKLCGTEFNLSGEFLKKAIDFITEELF